MAGMAMVIDTPATKARAPSWPQIWRIRLHRIIRINWGIRTLSEIQPQAMPPICSKSPKCSLNIAEYGPQFRQSFKFNFELNWIKLNFSQKGQTMPP